MGYDEETPLSGWRGQDTLGGGVLSNLGGRDKLSLGRD